MKKYLIIAVASLFVVSCNNIDNFNKNEKLDVVKIINLEENKVKQKVEKEVKVTKKILIGKEFEHKKYRQLTIGFNDDRIYGSTGVNRFFSDYDIKNEKLYIKVLGLTRAAGSDEDMALEDMMLKIIEDNKEMKYNPDDGTLKMITKQGYVHTFQEIKK